MLVDALVSQWKRRFFSSTTASPSAPDASSSSVVNTTNLGHSTNNNDTTAQTSLHSAPNDPKRLQQLVFGSPSPPSRDDHGVEGEGEGEGEGKGNLVGDDGEVRQWERQMLNEIEDNRPMGSFSRRHHLQQQHYGRNRNSSVVGTVVTQVEEDEDEVFHDFEEGEDGENQEDGQQHQQGQPQYQSSTLYRSQQLQFRMRQLQLQYLQQQLQQELGEDDTPESSEYDHHNNVPLRLHTTNIPPPPPPSRSSFHQYEYQQRSTSHHTAHHHLQPFIHQLSPIAEQSPSSEYLSPISATPASTLASRKSTQNSLIVSSNAGGGGGATTHGSRSSLRKPRSTSPPPVLGPDTVIAGSRGLRRKSLSEVVASGYGDGDLTIVADRGTGQEVAGNSTVLRFKSSSSESPITPITPATGATVGSPLSQYATPTSQTQTGSAGPASPSSGPGMTTTAAAGGDVVGEAHGGGTPELTRPSPVYTSPFLLRPLNRTASQRSQGSNSTSANVRHSGTARQGSLRSVTTSRTGGGGQDVDVKEGEEEDGNVTPKTSTRASTPGSNVSAEPPTIPPLDLRPHFPGPHPNVGPRPPRRRSGRRYSSSVGTVGVMPTIEGSQEGTFEEDDDYEYEEGVTRDDMMSAPGEEADEDEYGYGYGYGFGFGYGYEKDSVRYADTIRREYEVEAGPSGVPAKSPSPPSASESFITRRWDRDHKRGIPTRQSITTIFLQAKKQRGILGVWLGKVTPAFWAFWLGFICPVLWLVGGWHFTSMGEQPAKMGVWEFYFSGRRGGWKELICCCVRRKRRLAKGKNREVYPPLPRWISEKQSSDDGRARLNDPKRSLRGISFGYPFVARPPARPERRRGIAARLMEKPNRLLDHMYGVKLQEVRGRPESGRRMFDPWVQRCRYAFCYACAAVAAGLCVGSLYLIVFNTRQLR